MKNILKLIPPAVCVGVMSLSQAQAAEKELLPSMILPQAGGMAISFLEKPEDCQGAYKGFHAYLSKSNPEYQKNIKRIALARNLKEPVLVTYDVRGDCSSGLDATLLITNVN